MSKPRVAFECYCGCHEKKEVKHTTPCCDGKCLVCGRYITRGHMKTHFKSHEKVLNPGTW